MDAVVLAGGIPQPNEPLYAYTQGQPKALLDIGGKPMVQWVMDALCGSQRVENVVLVGVDDQSGVTCSKPLTFLPNQGGMIANIMMGILKVLEINPMSSRVVLATSDIPAITAELVDLTVDAALQTDVDLYLNVVKREVMERRYPGSRRTYTKLKDIDICVGDLNVLHTSVVNANRDIWEKLIASRKNPLKLAAIMGLDTLLLVLLRLITLDEVAKMVSARLHITGKAVICPYAEIGMDVDKPFQLELMRADLAKKDRH